LACLEVSLKASSSPIHDPCLHYPLAELDLLWLALDDPLFVPEFAPNNPVSDPMPAQWPRGPPVLHEEWVATVCFHRRGQAVLIPIDAAYSMDKS
jgi:hypothetical protein